MGRPRSRAESKALTRERLLRAAGQVFAARGYEAASITEIAERAEVATGSVYVHFASKQGLFWAVLSQRLAAEQATAAAAVDGQLQEYMTSRAAALDHPDAHDPTVALMAEAWLCSLREESFRAEMADHQRRVRLVVSELVERLRSRTAPQSEEWLFTDDQIAVLATALLRSLRQVNCVDPASVTGEMFNATMHLLLNAARP